MPRDHLTLAIAGLLTAGAIGTATAAPPLVFCAEHEKCYGVNKAGKNDCSTSTSACAGTARQDNQKDAWVYVPKGTCAKLTGGSLSGPAAKK